MRRPTLLVVLGGLLGVAVVVAGLEGENMGAEAQAQAEAGEERSEGGEQRPYVALVGLPHPTHTHPLHALADNLAQRGYRSRVWLPSEGTLATRPPPLQPLALVQQRLQESVQGIVAPRLLAAAAAASAAKTSSTPEADDDTGTIDAAATISPTASEAAADANADGDAIADANANMTTCRAFGAAGGHRLHGGPPADDLATPSGPLARDGAQVLDNDFAFWWRRPAMVGWQNFRRAMQLLLWCPRCAGGRHGDVRDDLSLGRRPPSHSGGKNSASAYPKQGTRTKGGGRGPGADPSSLPVRPAGGHSAAVVAAWGSAGQHDVFDVYADRQLMMRHYAAWQRALYEPLLTEFSKDRPDFVVLDRYTLAGFDVCHKLNLPYAVNNPALLLGLDKPHYMVPAPYSGIALLETDVWQRTMSLLMHFSYRIRMILAFDEINAFRKEHGLQPYRQRTDLIGHSLVLTNSVFGIEHPRPLVPLFRMTGPIVPQQVVKVARLAQSPRHRHKARSHLPQTISEWLEDRAFLQDNPGVQARPVALITLPSAHTAHSHSVPSLTTAVLAALHDVAVASGAGWRVLWLIDGELEASPPSDDSTPTVSAADESTSSPAALDEAPAAGPDEDSSSSSSSSSSSNSSSNSSSKSSSNSSSNSAKGGVANMAEVNDTLVKVWQRSLAADPGGQHMQLATALLLADNTTQLAVTDGSLRSTQLALMFGQPLVMLPLHAEEREVSFRVASAGAGVFVEPLELSPDSIAEAIVTVMMNTEQQAQQQRHAQQHSQRQRHNAAAEEEEVAATAAASVATCWSLKEDSVARTVMAAAERETGAGARDFGRQARALRRLLLDSAGATGAGREVDTVIQVGTDLLTSVEDDMPWWKVNAIDVYNVYALVLCAMALVFHCCILPLRLAVKKLLGSLSAIASAAALAAATTGPGSSGAGSVHATSGAPPSVAAAAADVASAGGAGTGVGVPAAPGGRSGGAPSSSRMSGFGSAPAPLASGGSGGGSPDRASDGGGGFGGGGRASGKRW